MDEIRKLIEISKNYYYNGKYYNEGMNYYTFQNKGYDKDYDKDYDENYRICYEVATNFINTSNVFSEFKPEEIIKVFGGMIFKNNRVLLFSNKTYWCYNRHQLKLFEELLKVNKEMLVALIKAINDNKITYYTSQYFIDRIGVLGADSNVDDNKMISLYRILLEYNNFSLDNLNIKNIINDIRPSMTKRAI